VLKIDESIPWEDIYKVYSRESWIHYVDEQWTIVEYKSTIVRKREIMLASIRKYQEMMILVMAKDFNNPKLSNIDWDGTRIHFLQIKMGLANHIQKLLRNFEAIKQRDPRDTKIELVWGTYVWD